MYQPNHPNQISYERFKAMQSWEA